MGISDFFGEFKEKVVASKTQWSSLFWLKPIWIIVFLLPHLKMGAI